MPIPFDVLYGYLVVINLIGFISMVVDKYKAKRGSRRISEAALLSVAAVGGSFGSLMGMLSARHKTRHVKFVVGIPLILALQTALALYLIF